jgi:hypothetical protein
MNTNESTYALLVRSESEEKGRGVLETVLYVFFILSAIVSIWQFAQQPVAISAPGIEAARCMTCATSSAEFSSQI